MASKERTDKDVAVHSHSGTLLSAKKEQTSDIPNKVDGCGMEEARHNTLRTVAIHSPDTLQKTHRRDKTDQWSPGWGRRREGRHKGKRKLSQMKEIFSLWATELHSLQHMVI